MTISLDDPSRSLDPSRPDPRGGDDVDAPRPPSSVTGPTVRRQLGAAVLVLAVLTVLLGVVYPLGVWALTRLPGLSDHAEGSPLPGPGGTPSASRLVGIDPVPADPGPLGRDDPWFHTRPSASAPPDAPAGLGPADPSTSGGSNLAPGADTLRDAVARRRAVIAAREDVVPSTVPPDALTASASGLDPHISPEYAALQTPRVARVTGLGADRVRALVAAATDGRSLGFLGEPGVNVPVLDGLIHAAAPGAR